MVPRGRIARNHGPVVYVMYFVGATAKLVLSSLREQPTAPFRIGELSEHLIPNYARKIEAVLDDTAVKADSTSKLNQIYSLIVDMIRDELAKTPEYCAGPFGKTGNASVEHLPLAPDAPEEAKRLWIFLRFIEKSITDKFIWRNCVKHTPVDGTWDGVLERLCWETNTSGNRTEKDTTEGKRRLPKLPDIFGEIFALIVGEERVFQLCKKMQIGQVPAALRATALWRDIESHFLTQKIRGPYFVYRRARSSMTNTKTDIDLIVRDFIWILPEPPESSDKDYPVLGYYFSAFDREVYEITNVSEQEKPRSMLKVDATAIRSTDSDKSLFLYAPTIPLDVTSTFTLGTITGTLRDTQRSGGWSCVLVRPSLDRKELQVINTVVYSFLRHLSRGSAHYGTEIDRLRAAIEGSGLAGVYTSRVLELEHDKFSRKVDEYVLSSECALKRRTDVMACFCHDEYRQKSIQEFARSLIRKHSLHTGPFPESEHDDFVSRIERALVEAVFESTTSSTVPTAGLDEIIKTLQQRGIQRTLYGPDGIQIAGNTSDFHKSILQNLSDCNVRKTIPMEVYEKLSERLRRL